MVNARQIFMDCYCGPFLHPIYSEHVYHVYRQSNTQAALQKTQPRGESNKKTETQRRSQKTSEAMTPGSALFTGCQ